MEGNIPEFHRAFFRRVGFRPSRRLSRVSSTALMRWADTWAAGISMIIITIIMMDMIT